VIDKPEVTLKRNRDRMKVHNKTNRDVFWTVPPGVFTELGDYREGIKGGKSSQDPSAFYGNRGDRILYTIKEAQQLRGKKRRRAKSRGTLADPVLIID
jgi:hypothetical protein